MNRSRAPILLLHGGWGGAWCWSAITPPLVAAGHPVLAPDLAGGGLSATEPASLYAQDPQGLAEERSALAGLSFAQYADPALGALHALHERYGSVVVVAHSINGMLLHYLGEQSPEAIRRLVYLAASGPAPGRSVYLAASGPAPGRSVAMDTEEEPWSSSRFAMLLVADPQTIGALRINPTSGDTGYREAMRQCWFADVPADTTAVAMRMLSSENPGALLGEPAQLSAQRWGSIPRTWIRTTRDASIPVTGQDTNTAELDRAFPANRFDIASLRSGHMPFLSVPEELVELLLQAAGTDEADVA